MQDIEITAQPHFTNDSDKETAIFESLDRWMSSLPPSVRALPINHLAIPGSHDTMTYSIKRNAKIGPDGPNFLNHLGPLSFIAKPIVFNWSITQHDDVTAQLNGGIRYLDLRIAKKTGTDEICFVHGLYGANIMEPLGHVADWLSSHPGEVVVLDFQHFYEFNDLHHQRLIDVIESLFEGKLCPVFGSLDHISLQWLALEKYQAIVVYRNVAAMNHASLWPGGMWPTPWADTVDLEYLVRFLNDKLESRSPKIGFVSQCILTPDTVFVAKHLCGNLERDLVAFCRHPTLAWIRQQSPGSTGLNIVISDFVSYDDFRFSKTVIERNKELLKSSISASTRKYIEVKSKS